VKLIHSPEPWKRGTDGVIFDAKDEMVVDCCRACLPLEGEENQKRIVACVNAMRGIDDPEFFVSTHAERGME